MSVSYLAAGGIVLAVFVLLGVFVYWIRRAGGDAIEKAIGEKEHDASVRIAEARGKAPADRAAIIERLRKSGGI